jgi:hypothetical protein
MKNIILIAALAIFWGLGGLLVGFGIQALVGSDWLIPCTSINMIAGLLMLLFVTRDEEARRVFYERVNSEDPHLGLALLWALPFSLIFLGVIWWLLAHFLK